MLNKASHKEMKTLLMNCFIYLHSHSIVTFLLIHYPVHMIPFLDFRLCGFFYVVLQYCEVGLQTYTRVYKLYETFCFLEMTEAKFNVKLNVIELYQADMLQ